MSGTAADLIARITGERSMGKYTGGGRLSSDAIARLAYELYERRGRQDGHDVDDWLLAEQELARHYR
jgi:Protein of unknown function (DUF2934)